MVQAADTASRNLGEEVEQLEGSEQRGQENEPPAEAGENDNEEEFWVNWLMHIGP